MKKKILITTLVAIAVCIGYFATLTYQDKEDVGNGEVVQGEEIGDTEEPANKIEESLAPIVEETDEPSMETIVPSEKPIVEEIVGPNEEVSGVPTEQPKTEEPAVEPTIKPTVKPTKQASTKSPTIEPTEVATKKPVITKTPTKAPTKKPTIKPTTKPTIKPTIKPTEKPVKTPAPTKKPSKTYWYEVPTEYGFDYIESNLPPEKYPVPEGYQPWMGPNYDRSIGAEVYWTQLLPKENVLAYNKDGSPDLKNTIVYGLDSDFLYFILDSKELNSYLKSKGIDCGRKLSAQSEFSSFGSNDVRSILYCVEYDGSYSNGAFNFRFDENYKVTEENPYD